MAADVQAPCVPKSSATIVMTIQETGSFQLQISVSRNDEKFKYISNFLKLIQHDRVYNLPSP